jgi:hypothetical protein
MGRVADLRHTAIAICINTMGCLKALDAEVKRFALSGDGLFKIELSQPLNVTSALLYS